MRRSVALGALLGASSVLATQCSLGSKCPKEAPCCSQYGECGVGAFCLGGCDPRSSYTLDSCVPAPVCKSSTTRFTSLDSIVDISNYLGDATKADWVAQGEPAAHGDAVLLTMPKNSVGTVLASTRYMWYGNVKARFKTSRGRGVVTAFILYSDVKDEIDYEFVGADLKKAQTNYYFQGIPDYKNSGNISLSDTFHNFHDYEIRWTPDRIEWVVDGQVGRVKERKDTWNETSQQWMYPQTPARVQMSIWPGGRESNAEGTIAWAGGKIDWDGAEDMQKAGYYYAAFSEVTMECYNAKSAPGTNSAKSYTYSSSAGTNDTVQDGAKDTVLGSLLASGLEMDKGRKVPSASSSAAVPSSTQRTIPGGEKAGGGQDHSGDTGGSGGGGSGGGGSGSGSTGGGGNSATQPAAGGSSNCRTGSFNQDCGGGGGGGGGGGSSGGTKASASALAMVIAGAALFWL